MYKPYNELFVSNIEIKVEDNKGNSYSIAHTGVELNHLNKTVERMLSNIKKRIEYANKEEDVQAL